MKDMTLFFSHCPKELNSNKIALAKNSHVNGVSDPTTTSHSKVHSTTIVDFNFGPFVA